MMEVGAELLSMDTNVEVMAFLGAVDDLCNEFTANGPDRRSDHEIMQILKGVRDQASEYYSETMVETFNLLGALDAQINAACEQHSHFGELAREYGLGETSEEHDHNHRDIEVNTHESENDKKRKKSKEKEKTKNRKTTSRKLGWLAARKAD